MLLPLTAGHGPVHAHTRTDTCHMHMHAYTHTTILSPLVLIYFPSNVYYPTTMTCLHLLSISEVGADTA